MKKSFRFFVMFAFVVSGVFLLAGHTHAVLFTATQVLINPGDRVSSVTVKNTSNKPKIYRFVWTQMAMNEDGKGLRKLKDGETVEGLMSVSEYIRFSPQRIRMMPGQIQQVRFLVRKKADMQDGEYRSYFSMEVEPEVEEFDGKKSDDFVSAGLAFDVGWRIPVILRHGELTADVKLVSAKLTTRKDGRKNVVYTIKRSGNISFMGPLRLVCRDGSGAVIAKSAVKVYTELTERTNNFIVNDDQINGCENMALRLYSETDDPVFGSDKLIGEVAVTQ